MANSLTNIGQQMAIAKGGIFALGTKIKLYTSASTPDKDGTGFTEVADGNGYTTGGATVTPWSAAVPATIPTTSGDWTMSLPAANIRLTLANKTWTASGGSIANIAGAYLTDASDNILAWWERSSPITITSGDTLTLDSLFTELT